MPFIVFITALGSWELMFVAERTGRTKIDAEDLSDNAMCRSSERITFADISTQFVRFVCFVSLSACSLQLKS